MDVPLPTYPGRPSPRSKKYVCGGELARDGNLTYDGITLDVTGALLGTKRVGHEVTLGLLWTHASALPNRIAKDL